MTHTTQEQNFSGIMLSTKDKFEIFNKPGKEWMHEKYVYKIVFFLSMNDLKKKKEINFSFFFCLIMTYRKKYVHEKNYERRKKFRIR